MPIDLNKIATAAAESYLKGTERSPNGQVEPERHRRFGGVGALALGAGLAVAARAAYSRVRRFDLERAAGRVEDKLSR